MAVAHADLWGQATRTTTSDGGLLEALEGERLAIAQRLDAARQAQLGQYFTPASVARLMAGLFPERTATALHLLDAGAGIGMLSAAWTEAVCGWAARPAAVAITAYELDPALIPHLERTLALCAQACARAGIAFRSRVQACDFIADAVPLLRGDLFAPAPERYDCAIINPPYGKMRGTSAERALLRGIGIEMSNLYTGFLALAMRLLREGGDIVAITPRSFCNGSYFRPFRRELLATMALTRVHLFGSRTQAFRDDAVLQETVIFRAARGLPQPGTVAVSESAGPDDEDVATHPMPFARMVHSDDPEMALHLVSDALGQQVAERMGRCATPLAELGLAVSTGRVVDFRATPYLRAEPGPGTVPLIYPEHCAAGGVRWPRLQSKKPQAIDDVPETAGLLVPSGTYVLVKRFSAKEERRRVVAAVYGPGVRPAARVGLENHLNYYHCGGGGIAPTLALGLAAFLNTTIVDAHFRQWSGSTQVNATDLRKLRYPSADALVALGARLTGGMPDQHTLDMLVEGPCLRLSDLCRFAPKRPGKRPFFSAPSPTDA